MLISLSLPTSSFKSYQFDKNMPTASFQLSRSGSEIPNALLQKKDPANFRFIPIFHPFGALTLCLYIWMPYFMPPWLVSAPLPPSIRSGQS